MVIIVPGGRARCAAMKSAIGSDGRAAVDAETVNGSLQFDFNSRIGGDVETVRRKEEVLLAHCEAVGRDPATIPITAFNPPAESGS